MSAGSATALFGDRRTILIVDLTCPKEGHNLRENFPHGSQASASTDVVVLPSLVSTTHSEYALVLEVLRAYHVPPKVSSTSSPAQFTLLHDFL